VTAFLPGSMPQRPCYRGSPCRWHPAPRQLSAAVFSLSLSLAAGGCSFSYQLDNLFAKKDEAQVERTGALRTTLAKVTPELPAEPDLAMASAAVNEVLTQGGKDSSMPWENPNTGARGTVTPLAAAHNQDGVTCRDFLVSYVKNGTESWMQGEACRAERGKWEMRSLRRWKKT
jgi:surface antigen